MTSPSVSIVVPNYNSGATLERAIQSLIAQDWPDLELIFVDGASTDDSLQVARRHAGRFAHLVSEPDRGQAHALNKGFRLAKGEILGWLCGDDELAPGAVRHVAEVFASRPEIDLYIGGCRRHYPDGTTVVTVPRPDVLDRISYHDGIEQPSTFWRASLARKAGELDESFRYAFDWDLWNRFARVGARHALTDHVLSDYYFSTTNKTSTGAGALVGEMYRVIRRYGPLRGRLADVYRLLYHFDLAGCYDRPVSCGRVRWRVYALLIAVLRACLGKELVYSYNWCFASKQQRGLVWWQ
jgi:glycosyltransferase involved in cell wall biosynthesis